MRRPGRRWSAGACRALMAVCVWAGATAACRAGAPKIPVLIFSGQNNHDWRATTPALSRILESSGRFSVDVTEHPERCTAASLSRYGVIVSNWNAFGDAAVREWPVAARDAVLGFVRAGKGFAVIHAGSSSFDDWGEYRQMTGAWWDLKKTGHGAQHPFYVQVVDPGHPVTRGLRVFLTRDELWHRAGTSPGAHPLVSAYSSPESGGSGQEEPLAFAMEFGKGRCFTLLLGHDAAAMSSAGFCALLRRGVEWAATGRVTQPWPTSFLDDAQVAYVLDQVRAYKAGDRREPLWMLEFHAGRVAGSPAAAELAAKLAAIATDSRATLDGRQVACRMLGMVGGAAQVADLASLLGDADLATYARMALERIPDPEATAALRSELRRASGATRIGIVNSLGARRDERSAVLLTALLRDADPATVAAALDALGRIGTPQALHALQTFARSAPAALRERCARDLVACADRLADRGLAQAARSAYVAAMGPRNAAPVRAAAFSGLVRLDRAGREGRLLSALRGEDPTLRRVAARLIGGDAMSLRAAARIVDRLPADVQPAVLAAAASAGDRAALPCILRVAVSREIEPRKAALLALGTFGRADVTPVLARAAASPDAGVREAAREALVRLGGAGVDRAIAAEAARAPGIAQRELIGALVARSARSEAPALLAIARNQPSAQAEAVAAVGALGGAAEIGPMLRLLARAQGDRSPLEEALAALCTRAHTLAPVREALASATGAYRVSLIAVLGAVGGKEALGPLRAALHAPEPAVRLAALQALANWSDGAPLDDLLACARSTDDGSLRAIALRGIAQLAPLATDRPAEQVAADVQAALGLAKRVEERRALVSALGKVPCLGALNAALACADEEGLRDEAALAALQVAGVVWRRYPAQAEQVGKRFAASSNTSLRDLASSLLSRLSRAENLALGATATNPDGLHPDGQGGGPEAAIDGDPSTYWDEEDNQKLYAIRVQLAEPAVVSVLRIQGYQQELYAPRDFEVLLDGKVAKKVENARYTANWLQVDLPPTRCSVVELRITGYYGASPAIRELEIYSKLPHVLQGAAQ